MASSIERGRVLADSDSKWVLQTMEIIAHDGLYEASGGSREPHSDRRPRGVDVNDHLEDLDDALDEGIERSYEYE